MKTPEQFALPLPPQGLAFADPAQHYITLVMWIVTAGFMLHCAWLAWRTRSALPLLLVAGGAICYLAEPMVDVLALVWHPRENQWVALETFGPVPVWGLGIYVVFFGAMTAQMLTLARSGITRKQFWTGVLAFFVVDVACELPIIHYGLYTYYGDAPLSFMGLPLYWLFINTLGPLMAVALLLRAPQFFEGWRRLLVPLLPMTTDIAGSVASGWPIMSALNAPGSTPEIKLGAAVLTVLLGLVIMDGLPRLICVPQAARSPALKPAGEPVAHAR